MHTFLFLSFIHLPLFFFFFFNDTATTEIYTLSLHDALPIFQRDQQTLVLGARYQGGEINTRTTHSLTGSVFFPSITFPSTNLLVQPPSQDVGDRKSTRLNSSHTVISYAVFCLKKKKNSHSTDPSFRKATVSSRPALRSCGSIMAPGRRGDSLRRFISSSVVVRPSNWRAYSQGF